MAIRAYHESYLSNAMTTMGTMLDYAVNYQYENIDYFFAQFILSGIADDFGFGSPNYISGKTGVELYYEVKKNIGYSNAVSYISINRTKEFWAGYYLAYAQWYLNRSFRDIVYAVPLSEIVSWYNTDHEADLQRFADKIEYRILKTNNNLQSIRRRNQISQTELANLSGVGLRNIQMFEQGKNDISKAQFNTLNSLSRTLNCSEQDLVQVIDFKQRLLDDMQKQIELKRKCEKELQTIELQKQFWQQQATENYINQFPYNQMTYCDNNYLVNRVQVQQNFSSYWNACDDSNKHKETILKMAELITGEIGAMTGNKPTQIVSDVLGIVNSKNIVELAFKIADIIKKVTN